MDEHRDELENIETFYLKASVTANVEERCSKALVGAYYLEIIRVDIIEYYGNCWRILQISGPILSTSKASIRLEDL